MLLLHAAPLPIIFLVPYSQVYTVSATETATDSLFLLLVGHWVSQFSDENYSMPQPRDQV